DGTLVPLHMGGDISATTSDFEVFDRAFDDPGRRHMIGVREAKTAGRILVRPDAVVFAGMRVDFGQSHLESSVSIGFHNDISLTVDPGSSMDLADISPLASLTLAGRATTGVEMHGKMNDPLLTGEIALADFSLAGFPLGDVRANVAFRPLTLDLQDV